MRRPSPLCQAHSLLNLEDRQQHPLTLARTRVRLQKGLQKVGQARSNPLKAHELGLSMI